jgi:hypothetical protein
VQRRPVARCSSERTAEAGSGMSAVSPESRAFMAALAEVAPDAPTACAEWSAHKLAAHVAAGAEEVAELHEDHAAASTTGKRRSSSWQMISSVRPWSPRPAARSQPSKLWPNEVRMPQSSSPAVRHRRPVADARAQRGRHPPLGSGRRRRVGRRAARPARPVRHGVEVLNTLPVLAEAPGARAAAGGLMDTRIVLRSPAQADVVLAAEAGGARFELATDGPATPSCRPTPSTGS